MQPDDSFYEAERAVHLRRFPVRLTDGQEYFDYVTGQKFFTNRWPHVAEREITVKASKHACAWADFNKNVIYLPPWASCDFTLLHEIAHFAADTVGHEADFRAVELALVRHYMGPEAARTLHHSMLAYELDH